MKDHEQDIFICKKHKDLMLYMCDIAEMFAKLPVEVLKQMPKDFFTNMKEAAKSHGITILEANDMATRMEKGLMRRRKLMEENGIEESYQKRKQSFNSL